MPLPFAPFSLSLRAHATRRIPPDLAEALPTLALASGVGRIDTFSMPAESYGTRDILTLDECYFRAMRGNTPFRLLPADP